MNCPKCETSALQPTLTRNSVILDLCKRCQGLWFDRGELVFFLKNRKRLEDYQRNGLTDSKETSAQCPKCRTHLKAGKIPGFRYEVEECPSCRGLWLDQHEFKKISEQGDIRGLTPDRNISLSEGGSRQETYVPFVMPSLAVTSLVTLTSMYALLLGVVVFLVEYQRIPAGQGVLGVIAFVLFQFFAGPWLIDLSLSLIGSLHWVAAEELPPHLRTFLQTTCDKYNIPVPRIGIIEDGTPQAYTYGRTPWSARLVVSRGTLDLLTPAEREAVVGHELGHIVHWDSLIMTIAQLVPILLYHLYRVCKRTGKSDKSDKAQPVLILAAIVAYVAYIISDYLVMFISRVREYWADKFSVEVTKDPNALVMALAKIGYGMTTQAAPATGSTEGKRSAVQALGIMNISGSKEMTLYSQGATNPDDLADVMRWDLWSPWAVYYELHSTHPLTAKRINAISSHAIQMGIEPAIQFDRKRPESYWDDFSFDLIVLMMPLIGATIGLLLKAIPYYPNLSSVESKDWVAAFLLGLGLGGFFRTIYTYPGGLFVDHAVLSLLKLVKVSPVTAHPVCVRGKIIGRGVAGNLFSEDMVIQDSSGMIFLNYEHGISNWYFAFFRLNQFLGKEAVVEGWYRRSPMPYIEVKRISTSTDTSRSYGVFYQMVTWLIFLVIGVAITL